MHPDRFVTPDEEGHPDFPGKRRRAGETRRREVAAGRVVPILSAEWAKFMAARKPLTVRDPLLGEYEPSQFGAAVHRFAERNQARSQRELTATEREIAAEQQRVDAEAQRRRERAHRESQAGQSPPSQTQAKDPRIFGPAVWDWREGQKIRPRTMAENATRAASLGKAEHYDRLTDLFRTGQAAGRHLPSPQPANEREEEQLRAIAKWGDEFHYELFGLRYPLDMALASEGALPGFGILSEEQKSAHVWHNFPVWLAKRGIRLTPFQQQALGSYIGWRKLVARGLIEEAVKQGTEGTATALEVGLGLYSAGQAPVWLRLLRAATASGAGEAGQQLIRDIPRDYQPGQRALQAAKAFGIGAGVGAGGEIVSDLIGAAYRGFGRGKGGGGVPPGSPADPDLQITAPERSGAVSRGVDLGAVTPQGRNNPVKRLPKEKGRWEGSPGESAWHSEIPDVNEVTGSKPIPFVNQRPVFSAWSRGRLTFKPGQLRGSPEDFELVYLEIAKRRSLRSKRAAKKWLTSRGLTPHHLDSTTIELIPRKLHGNIPHVGAASDLRGGYL
jgi:hypothetical protein